MINTGKRWELRQKKDMWLTCDLNFDLHFLFGLNSHSESISNLSDSEPSDI